MQRYGRHKLGTSSSLIAVCVGCGTPTWSARRATMSITRPPPIRPPPLRRPSPSPSLPGQASGKGLPPPPPLPNRLAATGIAQWKGPQEVLDKFVEFVPTFYVPINCLAATLDDECRELVKGRGKFSLFLKRYRAFFDVRTSETGMVDVKLQDDLSHPKRGIADAKYEMTDVGETRTYTVKQEFILSTESIELANVSVPVRPRQVPPSVEVQLFERVPVLDRLQSLIPHSFTAVEVVEEKIPEDVLFHPFFDSQGGLQAIAGKFPHLFQLVDGCIRVRPPELAPLATNSLELSASPIPAVAAKVLAKVCDPHDVPRWVSLTSIYEDLSTEEKRQVKKSFKSFAGFLRAHGKSVAVSQDMLQVSKWIPPTGTSTTTSSTAPPSPSTSALSGNGPLSEASSSLNASATAAPFVPTLTALVNELYERFPSGRTLSLPELVSLLDVEHRQFLPKRIVTWLDMNRNYFTVENPNEPNPSLVRVRRSSDTAPLDLAASLYPHIPEDGISQARLLEVVPEATKALLQRIGLANLVQSLPEWLELTDGDLFRKKSEEELEQAIVNEESKQRGHDYEISEDEEKARWDEKERAALSKIGRPKFDGVVP